MKLQDLFRRAKGADKQTTSTKNSNNSTKSTNSTKSSTTSTEQQNESTKNSTVDKSNSTRKPLSLRDIFKGFYHEKTIDITSDRLSLDYPLYKKNGKPWKNRINWVKFLKPGKLIRTNFGIFTVVNHYKDGKDWYVKLSDGTNYYTMKRNQARRNKKLPKTSTIEKIITLYDAEMINTLYESAVKIEGEGSILGTDDDCKVNFIAETYYDYIPDQVNKYRSQIIRCYHPDSGNNLTYSVNDLKAIWDDTIKVIRGY